MEPKRRILDRGPFHETDMRVVLLNHEDFVKEKTIVEHFLHEKGHLAYFLPKFHCELNAIERVWGQAKVYCRAHTNFTLVKLRQIINPALDSVSVDLIRKLQERPGTTKKLIDQAIKLGRASRLL